MKKACGDPCGLRRFLTFARRTVLVRAGLTVEWKAYGTDCPARKLMPAPFSLGKSREFLFMWLIETASKHRKEWNWRAASYRSSRESAFVFYSCIRAEQRVLGPRIAAATNRSDSVQAVLVSCGSLAPPYFTGVERGWKTMQ